MQNSRSLWPTHEDLLRRCELMDRMMEARGVDVLAALRVDGGLAFIEARAKCRYCRHEALCGHWLCHERRGPPDFCPNTAFFQSCQSIES